jgi:hypothetical protein
VALPVYEDHLLPRNSSALERVLSSAGARMQTLPVDIDLLKRPLDVPAQFLPHLAFELSVDVWKKRWSETRQRAVTAAALILQTKKGTAYCLREYARYADAEVIKIERPPMRVFSGKSLTKAEREAWLATLPQIRLWRISEVGAAGAHKAFLGGRSSLRLRSPRFCFGWPAPTPSTALLRLKARARWVVNGVETDIRVSNVGTAFRLHMPGLAGLRVFCDRPVAGRFYIPSDARFRLVTVAPAARLPWRSAVTPSLQAVTSEPERVVVPGARGHSVYCGMPAGAFFVPSSASLRIYNRFAVYDGRSPARRAAVQFMGVGRYGFPLHTAHVSISIPGKRNPLAAGDGIAGFRRRYWIPHDPARLAEARIAVAASKRLSDRIKFRIGPVRRFVASGKPILAGIDRLIVGRP